MVQSKNLGAAILATALSASCSLSGFDVGQVEVGIPSFPPGWAGLEGMELVLVWRDGEGRRQRLPVEPGKGVSIGLPQGRRRAILVEAWYRGRPLRPAGALWPDDLCRPADKFASPVLKARWFEGWTASVLVALDDFGAERGVDFVRLDAEARARLPDPWLIDPKEVALAIRERNFRSDSLSTGKARTFILPQGGPWIPESPFAEAPTRQDGSWLARLSPGFHRWYSRDLELFAAIPAEGDPVILVRAID